MGITPESHAGPTISGLLLAGGLSTRMGRDKALLEFRGEPLGVRALRVLDEVAADVLVASGDGRRLAGLGRTQVRDAIAGAGPLGGLVAGLEHAPGDLLAVLAVDMPFASPGVFRLLAGRWAPGDDAVVPFSDRGPEPLHALWAPSALPVLRRSLDERRFGVVRTLRDLSIRDVSRRDLLRVDPSGRFAFNVNRPEDLAEHDPPGMA